MAHKLRIGIVEDEAIIAQSLYEALVDLGYDVLDPAADFEEGIQLLKQGHPDLMILDIRLGEEPDGIEIGKYIKANLEIPFIFLTANADRDTINKAKVTSPAAYLVKPFTKSDLLAAIEIASNNYKRIRESRESDCIYVKEGNALKKISLDEIIYVESEHVYVKIYTKQRSYLHRSSLQQLLLKLNHTDFVQTHRSFLVNMQYAEELLPGHIKTSQYNIPVSRNYQQNVRRHFTNKD